MNAFSGGARRTLVGAAVACALGSPALAQQAQPPAAHAFEQITVTADRITATAPVFANAGFKLSESAETRFFVSALNSYSQLPGSITKAQLSADPEQANATSLAGRQKRNYELYRLANRTVIEFDGSQLELTAGYSYKDLFHPIFQVLQQRSNDYNGGVRYITEQPLGGFGNRFVIGASPSWNGARRGDD